MPKDEEAAAEGELTPKMAAFAAEWPVDWNATKAAMRAGYSVQTAAVRGYQLSHDPRIRKIVDAATQSRIDALGITKDRVLLELKRIAMLDRRKVAKWRPDSVETLSEDEDGLVIRRETSAHIELTPSDELDDDAAAAIAGIKMTKYGPEVQFESKAQALQLLGKELGMFKDRVEHSADESWAAAVMAAWGKKPTDDAK